MESDILDGGLAEKGSQRVTWSGQNMPVLALIGERFKKEKPLQGLKIAACLHVTSETANLMKVLRDGGADVCLCASNPLSTQDDVAAALVENDQIAVFAIRGEDNKTYYKHIHATLDFEPDITLDDGADLVSLIHKEKTALQPKVRASLEETTTGVIRLRAMAKDGALKIPVIAVNDADTKHLFDNRYGTGQSTVDGIIRATDILLAGRVVVACGYGWCGRGFADRASGMGARVVVTEVEPIRALEAVMDGFEVLPMREAAKVGDIFCTLTGNRSVLRGEHFKAMKDGAIVCNSGHFNIEIDIEALEAASSEGKSEVREHVTEYRTKNGRSIYLLAEGRLVNLAAARGHPSSVMDMSFAAQALTTEFVAKQKGRMEVRVHEVPAEIDQTVATLKLKSMGISIDELTAEQKAYLCSWEVGT
ncbi:MAG: adenosylhomocysteinase [Planctomycetota bacterium]|nr:adenosylhomocysteinase [Planctomycetota bacterium]